MQNMTEEAVKFKSDLRHTSTARARVEVKKRRPEKAYELSRVSFGRSEIGCILPRMSHG